MKQKTLFLLLAVVLLCNACKEELELTQASLDKIRLVWNDDPATTMTIGWDQFAGEAPMVYYGIKDRGRKWKRYKQSQSPTRFIRHQEMNTHFCELSNLEPDQAYYFVIKDSEGVSERYWFKTAPDTPSPFTCVIGGDTKPYEPSLTAGRFTNQMIPRLRPLFVLFNGDFTRDGKTAKDWAMWLTDWFELTRTLDGRLFPLVPVQGNHEYGEVGILHNIFNAPFQFEDSVNLYYSLSFGGDFMHLTILNSEIKPSLKRDSKQTDWLIKDLEETKDFTIKMAAYHKPFRPHTQGKRENLTLYHNWAYLFHEYGLDISADADSHMSKITYPVIPDSINGVEGFIRDDLNGTMFIGEGSWGASPRVADDTKSWTLRDGSFNQIKWLQFFPDTEYVPAHIDIRTVITATRDTTNLPVSHVDGVGYLTDDDVFAVPEGINLFSTEPYGAVIRYPFRRKEMGFTNRK